MIKKVESRFHHKNQCPRTVAIIQARMTSSRLPGKVLFGLGQREVLSHVILRLSKAGVFDDIVVATTRNSFDDKVAMVASENGASVFRGSEKDVLGRYLEAAETFRAEIIVRITADCPLIDPGLVSEMVTRFRHMTSGVDKVDLLSNCRIRTYPRGLDTEVFTRATLTACYLTSRKPHHREHVTTGVYENPDRFTIVDHVSKRDLSQYRLTLDTLDDYQLLRRIFRAWEDRDELSLGLREVIEIMENNPTWTMINSHVTQKPVSAGQ